MRLASLVLACLLLVTPTAALVQNGSSPSNSVGDGMAAITSAPAGSSQTFGSEGGAQYDVTFAVVNTTPELGGDRVEDVSTGNTSAEFTGYMEVPTPCHELSTSFEETGELVVTVEANSSGEACVQQLATKQYRMTVEGTEPFRLEVRHGESEVRTIETPGYVPHTNDQGGILGFLSDLLDAIF